jgi:hypothetical protein
MEVNGQLHAPAALTSPGTHWIEGWVGPSAGEDGVEKILAPHGIRAIRAVQPVAIPTPVLW